MTIRTLKRLERIVMRWYHAQIRPGDTLEKERANRFKVFAACAAHANAQRKGAKRKGR
jgi:hypothetical protein